MHLVRQSEKVKRAFWFNWLIAIAVMLAAGLFYRSQARQLALITAEPINLPIPLKHFPMRINGWAGRDVEIPEQIQRIAGNNDFINRLYINETTNEWANIYVAYSARPRTMVGHQPKVCYVAAGWVHNRTDQQEILSSQGIEVPCLLHYFHKPAPNTDEIIVLNFYILNGRFTADEESFTGLGWRTPNIAGDPARYVTQVQISSVFERSVVAAATEFIDQLVTFFPDEQGVVKAQTRQN